MSVGREQIEPAVKIVIEEENTEFEQEPAGRADAFGNGLIGKEQRPLRNIKRAHFVGEIANGDAERLIIAIPGCVDAHRATGIAVVVESDSCARADFLERAIALVVEDKIL